MNKSDFIVNMERHFSNRLTAKKCGDGVRAILEAMANHLVKKGRIEIRGFGSLCVTYRPSRIARDPRSGEKICVSDRYVPHFRPGKALKHLVDASVSRTQCEVEHSEVAIGEYVCEYIFENR